MSRRPPPIILPDGCYNGLDLGAGSPEARAAAIAERCAPSGEILFEGGPRAIAISVEQPAAMPLEVVDPRRCFSVFAAADGEVGDFDLVVRGADGLVLGRDALAAPIAVVGPVCARAAGPHRLELSANERAGDAAVQVVRAR